MNVLCKRELSSVFGSLECEFYGLLFSNGRISFSFNNRSLVFSSGEMFIIRKIVDLANKLALERKSDLLSREKGRFEIIFGGLKKNFDSNAIMKALEHATVSEKLSFLRGVYIGCGILSAPPSYHLELRFENARELAFVGKILSNVRIKHSLTEGRVFVKGRENVKKFLFDIGATESYLLLEEDAVLKGVSNKVNRTANFEYANLERQTNSSTKQIEAIEKLKENGVLQDLREDLRDAAILRLTYPYLSLSDVAKKSNGRFTKQSLYYRLNLLRRSVDLFFWNLLIKSANYKGVKKIEERG